MSTSSYEELPALKAHPKVGSMQQFVSSIGPIENFSENLFSADEVHKIAIFDLRICNLDRNACNILVQPTTEGGHRLIPIDHGLTIPDSLEICSYDLAWLSFDQASQPFSQRSLDYISKLDADADISFLEKNFSFRPECLVNMKITTLLLQQCAARGLTLAQIGEILCRPDEDDTKPSLLENIVSKAKLCSSLKQKMQSKIKDSMLFVVGEQPQNKKTAIPKSNSN